MSAKNTLLKNIFLATLLSLVTAFLTIEIGLRIFYPLIPIQVCAMDSLIATYVCQPYFVYDNPIRVGYHYKPGFSQEGMWDPASPFLANAAAETRPSDRSDAFYYTFQADEMGFPNNEYEWKDQYDIVIAGDSFTIRTAPKTWIELLQEQTGQTILTLGAPSWSPMNEVEAIKLYGLDKNPQWVVLMFFEGNDIIGVGQYLDRQDGGLSWKAYDYQDVPLSRRLLTPYVLRFFGQQLFPPPTPAEPPHYRYPVVVDSAAGTFDTVLKDIHLWPLSAPASVLARSNEYLALQEKILELKTLTDAQGAKLLVLYVPSKERVVWSRIWDPTDVNNVLERTVTATLSNGESGKLEWQLHYLSYEAFSKNNSSQEQLLAQFTAENNIQFLSLAADFFNQTVQQGELYHYADPHWNQAGNQLAADLIAAYLASK